MDNNEMMFNEGFFQMMFNELDEHFGSTEPTLPLVHNKVMEIMNQNPVMKKEFDRQMNIMMNNILKEDE